ncbi:MULTISPECIES: DUF1565 domain-containing protein [Paenibacillus]|uniref:DUF1565 domain-containing protein n=2 Tax=Paenibacillus TaxID=44249 RepID=A0ABX2ZBC4_PAEPO|nr:MULTISPECIES: DUF1565 domain-containing protein [Paenibacillus]MDR6779310.1 hypothetical protein [Paenibacillus peoriae]ODA08114.1 hypothetical protein A7312_08785 [Paenibacillus polymyxa]
MPSFGGFIESFSKILYVNGTSGLDTNTGSANSPFKTISKAVASVNADKTLIYIAKEGTYTESRLTSVLNANYEITIASITLRDKTKHVILSLANVTAGGFTMNKANTFIGLIIQRPSSGNEGRTFEYFFDGSVLNLSFKNCVWDNKPYSPTWFPIFAGNSAGSSIRKLEYVNCSMLPIFSSNDTNSGGSRGDFINCTLANNFTPDVGNIVTSFDADYNPTTQTTANGVYNGEFAWGSLKYIKVILSSNNRFYSTTPKKISDSTTIPKMTNNAAPSGLAFSKGAYGTNEAYLAFNQIDENEGYCSTNSSGGAGFLGYKFTAPKIIAKYVVRNGTLTSYNRLPKNWTFEGSNNSTNGFDGTWEVLDRQSKQTWNTPITDKVFEFENVKAFTTYRLNWTANGGATDYTSVGELKMFELLTVPNLIVMSDNNEYSFQKYGMNFDSALNLSNRLNRYIDIQFSDKTLGSGKTFEHTIDMSKKRVNNFSF